MRMIAMALCLVPVLAPCAAPLALAEETAPVAGDIRETDPEFRRMQRLFGAVRDILEDAAEARAASRDESGAAEIVARQFGMDSASRADRLLGEAFSVVADAPVTRIQNEIRERRAGISALRERIARLREDRISAPDDAGLRGTVGLVQDRASIDAEIAESEARIAASEIAIRAAKERFRSAMADAGVALGEEETELLLDSVTGSDLVRMAAAHRAVRGISEQLLELLDSSGEDLTVAKRYYAMHTALLALIVHAQTEFIEKVDGDYLPQLTAIESDIHAARKESNRLLRGETDTRRREALEGNIDSQRIALEAAEFYGRHLRAQRDEVRETRKTSTRELEIADNTLRTVDASFQLRGMMESATMAFEALQSLENPGIERIFRNEQLRREFQELSARLSGS